MLTNTQATPNGIRTRVENDIPTKKCMSCGNQFEIPIYMNDAQTTALRFCSEACAEYYTHTTLEVVGSGHHVNDGTQSLIEGNFHSAFRQLERVGLFADTVNGITFNFSRYDMPAGCVEMTLQSFDDACRYLDTLENSETIFMYVTRRDAQRIHNLYGGKGLTE